MWLCCHVTSPTFPPASCVCPFSDLFKGLCSLIEANSFFPSSYSKCVVTFFSANATLTSLNWALQEGFCLTSLKLTWQSFTANRGSVRNKCWHITYWQHTSLAVGKKQHWHENTVESPAEGDAEPVTCKPSQCMKPEQKWQLSCSLTWAIAALCLLSVFASRWDCGRSLYMDRTSYWRKIKPCNSSVQKKKSTLLGTPSSVLYPAALREGVVGGCL